MAQVIPFRLPEGSVFDAETTSLLAAAFERACVELSSQPPDVRDIVARRIVEIAGRGHRDPDQLWKAALDSLGLPRTH